VCAAVKQLCDVCGERISKVGVCILYCISILYSLFCTIPSIVFKNMLTSGMPCLPLWCIIPVAYFRELLPRITLNNKTVSARCLHYLASYQTMNKSVRLVYLSYLSAISLVTLLLMLLLRSIYSVGVSFYAIHAMLKSCVRYRACLPAC